MTTCHRCGQIITDPVIIKGLPYGSTCAETVLGIRQLPIWFKGGDWDKAKEEYELNQADQKAQFEKARTITREFWSEYCLLSKIARVAYRDNNDWGYRFATSILDQLGYPGMLSNTSFETMDEAEKSWLKSDHDFIYLYSEPRRISTLSDKQKQIIDRMRTK